MAHLGELIEEKGKPPPFAKCGNYAPLNHLVEKKIFTKPPTLAQRRAIEVALNTPDIALIQGPPGTGKTTVIAAIIERLNQIFDKSAGVKVKY